MDTPASNFRLRIVASLMCALVAVVLHGRAEAKATSPHDFYHHSIHPWGSTSASVLLLVTCVASLVVGIPVLRRGTTLQRIVVGVALVAPLLILVRYLVWAAHQWAP